MERYKLLEHTADIGVEAWAESREGLAEQSGRALCFLLFENQAAFDNLIYPVKACGETIEEVLVNWLNELLFILLDQKLLASGIEVRLFNEREIVAEVRGEHFDPDQHQMLREIKAVTHHQTRVDHDEELWHSRVYLDL